MKAYLAGKITGDENYKQKFANAESQLKQKEFDITISPAILPDGMSAGDYMRICFAMIDISDVVAFLPDWADSKGASLEHAYCQYISKQTFYLSPSPRVVPEPSKSGAICMATNIRSNPPYKERTMW